MDIKLYYSSASGSREVKSQQEHIIRYLNANNIKYHAIDVCESVARKEEMRRLTNNPNAMPPQIFYTNLYCGGYDKFLQALEDGQMKAFLNPK